MLPLLFPPVGVGAGVAVDVFSFSTNEITYVENLSLSNVRLPLSVGVHGRAVTSLS